MRRTLKRLWRGEFSLAKTYWFYGVLIQVVVILLLGAVGALAEYSIFWAILTIAGGIALLLYMFVVLVGIWRSADRYEGEQAWAVLAKVAVVVGFVNFAIILLRYFI